MPNLSPTGEVASFQDVDQFQPARTQFACGFFAPNGHKVVLGFRQYVLANNWHPENLPLQEEGGRTPLDESNPSPGGGTR